MRATDLELLRRVQHGDEAAFHALVDRFANYLFGVAVTLTGNVADAEDAVQETFAGMFRGSAGFREQASVKTWLVRILARQCARGRRRVRGVVFRLDGSEAMAEDKGLSVGSAQVGVDVRVDIAAALKLLSREHREVVVLREMEGLSYEEIAEALGVPRGTVESRLYRARQDLKRMLKEYL